jgi:hypothetical protein
VIFDYIILLLSRCKDHPGTCFRGVNVIYEGAKKSLLYVSLEKTKAKLIYSIHEFYMEVHFVNK